MSEKKIVTRMAPSPTGEFHIGGMRTLLFNWAFAKKNNGNFIVRIEDTDRARLVEGATERLLEVVTDYGFSWDQGPEVGGDHAPYVQSERLDLYKRHALDLVSDGKAYYCFCTSERLDQMREEQKKKGITSTKYDGHCLHLTDDQVAKHLSENTPFVIRLKVPNNRVISWVDGVLGKVSFNSNEIDDQILLKSDGFPTYHLGVVVDDHLMEVTHVMRGNEWLPSTPKHILLYEAFGWEIPMHLHLPNLKELGSNQKLSKRHGPVSARGFLDEGYLAEALVNYLMFLGWNPGTEKEIYSLDEFVQDFTLEKIHKADLVAFDRKKLEWYNGQYIQLISDSELSKRLKPFAHKDASEEILNSIAPLVKGRIKKLSEFAGMTNFYFETSIVDHTLFSENSKDHVNAAYKALSALDDWLLETINEVLMNVVTNHSFKTGEFFMNLRVSITGQKISPPINESLIILGKDEVISRLEAIIKVV